MDPLKMYFLLNMGIFHSYVSLPEGIAFVIFVTLHETNIFAPENRPGPKSKRERIPTIHFQVLR